MEHLPKNFFSEHCPKRGGRPLIEYFDTFSPTVFLVYFFTNAKFLNSERLFGWIFMSPSPHPTFLQTFPFCEPSLPLIGEPWKISEWGKLYKLPELGEGAERKHSFLGVVPYRKSSNKGGLFTVRSNVRVAPPPPPPPLTVIFLSNHKISMLNWVKNFTLRYGEPDRKETVFLGLPYLIGLNHLEHFCIYWRKKVLTGQHIKQYYSALASASVSASRSTKRNDE